MMDIIVVGAGPAGLIAALHAGELGARTALVARDAFGGMAANDGRVEDLARIPLSFPTYTGILGRAAFKAIRQIDPEGDWQANELMD